MVGFGVLYLVDMMKSIQQGSSAKADGRVKQGVIIEVATISPL